MSEGVVDAPALEANLSRRTVAGLRWTYIDALGNAAIHLCWTAISSRLLEPRLFGLMAIATLAINFGAFFSRMGVAHALVQKEHVSERDVRACLTSGVATGLLCFVIMWASAPAISGVFRDADVIPLLRVLGLSFLFTGLTMTSHALLRRALRFREIALVHLASNLTSVVVGVGLALAGAGVWSLMGYALSSSVVSLVLLYSRARHSLRPELALRPFRALYSFGIRVSLLRLMEFFGKNLDTLVVGRFLTAGVLGQYNRAYTLVMLPLNRYLSNSLATVLFPSFSAIQGDDQRLRRGYMSMIGLAGVVLLPICAGMAVAASEIVAVVLGDQWDVAASLVPLFALGAGFNILTHMTQLLCEARAELNRNMLLQGGYVVCLGLALGAVALAGYGVTTLASVLLVGEVLRHVAFVVLVRKVLDLSRSDLWQAYAPAAFAAATVALLVASARLLIVPAGPPTFVVLGAEIATGALALAIAIRCNPVAAVRHLIRTRLRNAGVLRPGRPLVTRLADLVLGAAT